MLSNNELQKQLEEADEAWTASNESPPFSLFVAKWFYAKGVRDAAEKCVEVFTNSNATYRKTRDQHDDGRSSGAEECERAILSLLDGKGEQDGK